MIAVDTSILVYAHRADSEWHAAAARRVTDLAEGSSAWAIPWPCVHEFLSVVTHPRLFKPPSPLQNAVDAVSAWMESPSLVLLAEGPSHWDALAPLLANSSVSGARIHDAKIAALCLQHSVRELWTVDRDFGRFPALKTRNPLVG